MPVNRAPNIPTIGPVLNPDPAARLLAPLFLIPCVGCVIKRDTGQNTAQALPLLVPLRPSAKQIIRVLGPMFYCRPPRHASFVRLLRITLLRPASYVRPRRITPLRPTHLKTFIYVRPLRITLLPATTWIRFVIIK